MHDEQAAVGDEVGQRVELRRLEAVTGRGDHDRVGVREVRRQVVRRFERVALALGVRLEVLEAVERVELAVALVPQHRRAVGVLVVDVQQELLVAQVAERVVLGELRHEVAVVDELCADADDGSVAHRVDADQRDVDVVRILDGVALVVAVPHFRRRLGGHHHQ
ncbi:hypothetical protein BRD10_04940 [Halobacteriales archaeon SW_12_71_31]|nr:MAG: hypothetical protein BRD10_04940 [Halobacteriales archaeon SW_12_71_31]